MNRNQQQKPCASSFKGVHLHKSSQKWLARITPESGKRIYIGCFSYEIDAARAYNEKATSLYGAFAHLNIL